MKVMYFDKKCLLILVQLMIASCVVCINNEKDKYPHWDMDFNEMKKNSLDDLYAKRILCPNNALEECEEERNEIAYLRQLFKPKPNRITNLNRTILPATNQKFYRIVPFVHPKRSFSCSCSMEHRLLDLGIVYYPRYVPTAICKPGGCLGGPYKCHPIEYKVRVLKEKQSEEDDTNETDSVFIPENLKDSFLSESVTVVVACECAP